MGAAGIDVDSMDFLAHASEGSAGKMDEDNTHMDQVELYELESDEDNVAG